MRVFAIVASLTLLLGSLLPLAAQEGADLCGGLNPADCASLGQAGLQLQEAGSFHAENLQLNLSGFGGTSEGNDLLLEGSGAVLLGAEPGQLSGFSLALEGGFNGESDPLQLRWVEDMLYISESDDPAGEWAGASTADLEGDPLLSLLRGEFFLLPFSSPGMTQFSRAEDTSLEGQPMQVYVGDVDLQAFLLTEPMLALLELVIANAPQDEMGGPGAMMGSDVEGAVRLLSAFMVRDAFTVTLWVGAEDQHLHRFALNLDILMNAGSMGEIGLTLNLQSDITQHGAAVKLEAPAEYTAQTLDLAALLNEAMGVIDFSEDAGSSPPDLTAEATLSVGEMVTGTLAPDNPYDVWAFEGSAGQVVSITLQAADVTTGLDTVLELYDASGESLAFNDDHFSSDPALDVFDSRIAEFTLPADGTYALVARWQAELRDPADYTLLLELQE